MLFSRKKRILRELEAQFGQTKSEGFNFQLISRYHENKDQNDVYQVLSQQTCNDLDFDLFFQYVDRTSSKIGQQFLYDKLRTIDFQNTSSTTKESEEKLIHFFTENKAERLQTLYLIQQLNNKQSYYLVDLFQTEIEQKPKWFTFIPLLSFTAFLSLILAFFNTKLIVVFVFIYPINVLIHYGLKRKTNLFLNSVPSLLSLGAIAKKLAKTDYLKSYSNPYLKHINTIAGIRKRLSLFKLDQKIDSDFEAAYWILIEFIKIAFLLEPLLVFQSVDKIRANKKEIEAVFGFVGKIDTLLSIASLRFSLDEYCVPQFSVAKNNQNQAIQFKNLRHPLIHDCVSNDLSADKSVLITGSNMSGKTTFIRSIGLNYISGINLNTCFASEASLPIAKLFSSIRIADDLSKSSSYFYREISEVKQIIDAQKSGLPALVLLDELFKGTNTCERIASAKAVLSYLSQKSCQIFVSTHDLELCDLLKDSFELCYFSEHISDGTIHFDFQLKNGVPNQGNAISILEISGFPNEVTCEAREIINQL